MIVLDTCALIFDALSPEKLSAPTKKAINHAEKKGELACCDISLWEIAMLIKKKRLDPGTDTETFLRLIFQARDIHILSINADVAILSANQKDWQHFDPADRIIVATTLHNKAKLVTCDKKLQKMDNLTTLW